eukprot:IDg13778t1
MEQPRSAKLPRAPDARKYMIYYITDEIVRVSKSAITGTLRHFAQRLWNFLAKSIYGSPERNKKRRILAIDE